MNQFKDGWKHSIYLKASLETKRNDTKCTVNTSVRVFYILQCTSKYTIDGYINQRFYEHHTHIYIYTSSTAQSGDGSFKNRKPIGEVGCCESRMAERSHWWTDRWLRSLLFLSLSLSFSLFLSLSLSFSLFLSLSLSFSLFLSFSLSFSLFLSLSLIIYLPTYLSFYLSIHPSIHLSIYVSCTAPATENASLQILFKCPTPAIVFGNATKPSRFAHFWQGA